MIQPLQCQNQRKSTYVPKIPGLTQNSRSFPGFPDEWEPCYGSKCKRLVHPMPLLSHHLLLHYNPEWLCPSGTGLLEMRPLNACCCLVSYWTDWNSIKYRSVKAIGVSIDSQCRFHICNTVTVVVDVVVRFNVVIFVFILVAIIVTVVVLYVAELLLWIPSLTQITQQLRVLISASLIHFHQDRCSTSTNNLSLGRRQNDTPLPPKQMVVPRFAMHSLHVTCWTHSRQLPAGECWVKAMGQRDKRIATTLIMFPPSTTGRRHNKSALLPQDVTDMLAMSKLG